MPAMPRTEKALKAFKQVMKDKLPDVSRVQKNTARTERGDPKLEQQVRGLYRR